MAPGVQALSGSPSWVVQPLSLVRAPNGRSGVAPAGTGAAAALLATAGEVAGLAMAFVVDIAAGGVVALAATKGNVGRVDAAGAVGTIGSGVGSCALETCAAGGVMLAVLGVAPELLQATETATHIRHVANTACQWPPRTKRRLLI